MSLIISIFSISRLAVFLTATGHAQTRLLLFSGPGCTSCKQWKNDVGIIFAKTAGGGTSPRIGLAGHEAIRGICSRKSDPHIDPTFVLVNEEIQVARKERTPGEGFLHGRSDTMLEKRAQEERSPWQFQISTRA
ncbi:MAG: hypothetical protein ACE5DK_08575 [Paracoccaceae bacterium]